MSSNKSLTQHLLSLDPAALHHATHAPFLSKAATSTLPASIARSWLAQDRLYALSYVTFAATLLSKVRIPTPSNRLETLEWRIADSLIAALTSIKDEIKLFEDVAKDQGWSDVLDATVPDRATREYQGLFATAAGPNASVLRGLVVLWATEECYLRAFSGAAETMGKDGGGEKGHREEGSNVMAKTFIPNWSSKEFQEVVAGLKGLVDELGKTVGEEEWRDAEGDFSWVLRVEKDFWPKV
jgi:thiaminase